MADALTESLNRSALEYAEPLARQEQFAAAVGAVIDARAAVALSRIASDSLVRQLTGVTTETQRRADRERKARRALIGDGDRARLKAAAFWHEGGEGPPLLLLNGWTASGLMWPSALTEALDALAEIVEAH